MDVPGGHPDDTTGGHGRGLRIGNMSGEPVATGFPAGLVTGMVVGPPGCGPSGPTLIKPDDRPSSPKDLLQQSTHNAGYGHYLLALLMLMGPSNVATTSGVVEYLH